MFENVFGTAFSSPDTLMMEVMGFCASHYGIQMAVPAGQSPAGLLAAVLVQAKITYNDNPFLSVDTDANRMEIVFAISARWVLRSEPLFRRATPAIPFPGIPSEAMELVETLVLLQDGGFDKSSLQIAGELMKAISSYATASATTCG